MSLPTKVDFIKDRFDPFTEIYSPNNISDEQHTIPSSSPFYIRTKEVVKEDAPSSIEIWTGAGKTGTQYTEVSSAPGPGEFQVDYKFQSGYIRFNEANGNTGIYITYKGLGDVIQAAHINTVQNVLNLDNVQEAAAANKVIKTGGDGYLSKVVDAGSIESLPSDVVKQAQVKTATGSMSANDVEPGTWFSIIMNDYCFFPNTYCVGRWLWEPYIGDYSDYVGRFRIKNDNPSGSQDYHIRWRYVAAS